MYVNLSFIVFSLDNLCLPVIICMFSSPHVLAYPTSQDHTAHLYQTKSQNINKDFYPILKTYL